MTKLSIIVPVYYNDETLPLLFQELLKVEEQLRAHACDLELIFVDDGSGDHSFAEMLKIREQRPATRLVKLARNFGAIHSSKIGLNFVTGDCFMWLSADLQDPPALVMPMVEKWQEGSKLVLAVRNSREDPKLSKLYAAAYYVLVRSLIAPDYPKGGFDIMLMDSSLLPYLRDSGKNVNTTLLSYWLGFKPAILLYDRPARLHGKSRWTFAKRLTYFIDSMLGFSVLPIRLISLIGAVVALLSFAYGAYIFVSALLGYRDVAGFPTLVSLIGFLMGLVIIMLGIIAEYVWRIFDEVTKRPEVVIDEVY